MIPHYRHKCTTADLQQYIGESPFVVHVFPSNEKSISEMLDLIPHSRILAFVADDQLRGYFTLVDSPRAVAIKTFLGNKVHIPGNDQEPFIKTLDWHHDVYACPIDLIVCCNKQHVPSVVVGGVRTLSQTRYLLLAACEGLDNFLPNYDIQAIYSNSILLKNRAL